MRTTRQETGLIEMVNEKPTRERMWARQILAIAILTACTAAEGFDVYVPKIYAGDHIAAGRLVALLEDWCPPFSALTIPDTATSPPHCAP